MKIISVRGSQTSGRGSRGRRRRRRTGVKQKLNRFGSKELQQNNLYQVWVGAHRVGASELKGLESLGVGAPK